MRRLYGGYRSFFQLNRCSIPIKSKIRCKKFKILNIKAHRESQSWVPIHMCHPVIEFKVHTLFSRQLWKDNFGMLYECLHMLYVPLLAILFFTSYCMPHLSCHTLWRSLLNFVVRCFYKKYIYRLFLVNQWCHFFSIDIQS